MDILREPHPTSQIAQERVEPGPPGRTFLALALCLGLAVCGVAAYVGLRPGGPFPVEVGAGGNPGSLYYPFGLQGAREVAAFAAGCAAVACAFAARRLSHSDGVGLLAGTLLALDPGFLATARLATPDTLALASLLGALACFLTVSPRAHWFGAGLLVLAGLVEPRSVLWSLPLWAMAMLRGHIYAAPRHLGKAAVQTVAAPAVGALLNLVSGAPGFAVLPCSVSPASGLALLQAPDYGTVAAVHDPVVWFGGLGALLLMAVAALAVVANQFRMARLPGRLQLRLAQPLSPLHGRALWLLALALAAPFGAVWLALFAIALAVGIGELADDAPGFGVTVALVVVAFAAIALARAWTVVHGMGDVAEGASGLVPWGSLVPCNG